MVLHNIWLVIFLHKKKQIPVFGSLRNSQDIIARYSMLALISGYYLIILHNIWLVIFLQKK